MFRLQHQVFREVIKWLKQGERCWLATITHTYGSSPRPVGSIMACNAEGTVIGSLSGGCVEEVLIKRIIHSPDYQHKPCLVSYSQHDQENLPYKLPCGGDLKILLEPLFPRQLKHFEELLCAIESRKIIQRVIDIPSGKMQLKDTRSPDFYITETQLLHTLLPKYQLFITGINPISLYVAEMANSLDFHVTLCDPRESFHQHWDPENYPYVTFTEKLPDDVIRANFSDPYSAITALAHDPRIDDMALMEALTSEAFYIGAMGSKTSTQNRKTRLRELGLNGEQISALHAPIGLSIGSKTPMEIAVSIVAQLTLIRNKHRGHQTLRQQTDLIAPA